MCGALGGVRVRAYVYVERNLFLYEYMCSGERGYWRGTWAVEESLRLRKGVHVSMCVVCV